MHQVPYRIPQAYKETVRQHATSRDNYNVPGHHPFVLVDMDGSLCLCSHRWMHT